MKELDWNSLTTKKYIKLARAKKMTLIGLGKNSNYKKYRFDECGHEKECTAQHLKGNPKCLICLEERLTSEALKAGLNIVGNGGKTSTRVYECRKCNYRFENLIRNIRIKQNQECANCEEDRFKKEALAIGLELVSKGTQNAYRNYKFIKCGHVDKFQMSAVRINNVKCSKCSEIKYENEAAKYGLKILGPGQKPSYRKYKFDKCGHTKEMLPANVRRNNGGSCEICFETKIKEDAKKAGLKFIKKANKRNKYTYKAIKCGHFQDFLLEKVRNKAIRCSICLQIKHENEAAEYGLKILGPGKKSTSRKYKFLDCGHTKEMEPSAVRLHVGSCQICFETKIKEDAKKAGLKFIKKTNKKNKYTYKVIKCGHFQDFIPEKVSLKMVRCSPCLQIKHENEAAKYGLKILGPGKKSTSKKYKFLDCGHTKEMEPSAVRLGFFTCQICEDTSRTQPSNVYLLKIKAGDMQWLKLGYSKRIESRIKQYQLPTNSKIIKLSVVKFKTGNAAHSFEASLHRKFKKQRLPSKKMKEFHTTGFDECYPLEMKDKLLKELANLGNK
ncbi:GIY-YIG nuclease family protein [Gammaproteobacteria bacterium]|nr:GIY-YIG nuclease family protein [Gammaproteobacteria bacterium]